MRKASISADPIPALRTRAVRKVWRRTPYQPSPLARTMLSLDGWIDHTTHLGRLVRCLAGIDGAHRAALVRSLTLHSVNQESRGDHKLVNTLQPRCHSTAHALDALSVTCVIIAQTPRQRQADDVSGVSSCSMRLMKVERGTSAAVSIVSALHPLSVRTPPVYKPSKARVYCADEFRQSAVHYYYSNVKVSRKQGSMFCRCIKKWPSV